MNYLLRKGLFYLLALLMVANPPVLQQLVALAQGPPKPVKNELTPEDLKRMADEMEKAFKALEAAEKEIPRDTFDPKAIVDKVGRDPVKLFEWVRDNTYWVPYQGCLRGHTGVLMDRLGSNLDRALLLAELLRVAGHKVRLARAELSEEQAKELLPKLRPVPEHPLPPTPRAGKDEVDRLIEKYAKQYQFDAAAMQKTTLQASLKAAKMGEEIAQRVADQSVAILQAIGKPSAKDAEAARAREATAQLESLCDHWWVQRREGNAWVDLDPLLSEAQPSRMLAKATETIELDRKGSKFHLESKFCHEVLIRVVIEQWKEETLNEKVVLNHTLRPSELFGQRVALRHIPMNWPRSLNLFEEKEPLQKLKTTMLAEKEWMPVLTVGSSVITDLSFSDSGDTYPANLEELATSWGFKQAGGSAANILKTGRIGKIGSDMRPDHKSKGNGQLTAQWIEYEIRSPGEPPQKIRRQMFDLIGSGWRSTNEVLRAQITVPARLVRALALMGETEILPLVCRLSPVFVQHLAADYLLANRKALLRVMRPLEEDAPKKLLEHVNKITPPPGRLYALALARQEFSKYRSDVYLDRPNILSFHKHLQPDLRGDILSCRSFDIVANRVAVRRGSSADPFLIRVQQGVIDTNAEGLLMGGCAKVKNTAEIFATVGGANPEWLTVRSAEQPTWKGLNLPKNVRARIGKDLSAGYIVMVPKKLVVLQNQPTTGWWRIDPHTGETLGLGPRGWGSAAVEYFLFAVAVIGLVDAGWCFVENFAKRDASKAILCLYGMIACELAAIFFGFAVFQPVSAIVMLPMAHVADGICALMAIGASHVGGSGGESQGKGSKPEATPTSGTPTPTPTPPPLESDPHLPGLTVPPWHDLG